MDEIYNLYHIFLPLALLSYILQVFDEIALLNWVLKTMKFIFFPLSSKLPK